MPRKINPDWTIDTIEDEVLFTEAALGVDPDAIDFLPMVEGWMPQIDETRLVRRRARRAHNTSSAARTITNARLDHTCESFGDQLYLAVGKNRDDTTWRKYFKLPVSRFVRTALGRQITTVRGWLTTQNDTLEPFREDLTHWSDAAQKALDDTIATSLVRANAQQHREKLAEDLTRERDALRDALAARGRERKLDRDWPDLFFIKSR